LEQTSHRLLRDFLGDLWTEMPCDVTAEAVVVLRVKRIEVRPVGSRFALGNFRHAALLDTMLSMLANPDDRDT
jgi:hypothetical protein